MSRVRQTHWSALTCVAAVVLSLWVHRRALGVFFSLDDFMCLERATGVLPPHPLQAWRYLSDHAYFTIALRTFGRDPLPYHVLNWLLHGLNTAMLFLLVRRWKGTVLAAGLAAVAFGASRFASPVLIEAVEINDLLALSGTLLALLVVDPNRPLRIVVACALFGLTMLCKEGVFLIPLLLVIPLPPAARLHRRLAAAGALLATGVAWLAVLAVLGARQRLFSGGAYATAFGSNLFHNLMTYAAWSVDLRSNTPDVESGFLTTAWQSGLWVVAALIAIVALRRRALTTAGAAWFALALAPVLPLVRHTYLQYAYVASAGLAIVASEAWEGLTASAKRRVLGRVEARRERGQGRRERWASRIVVVLTVALGVAYVVSVNGLMARRWERRTDHPDLPADPALRKAELARNASGSLGRATGGRHVRLVVIAPPESQLNLSAKTGEHVAPAAAPDLLASVLDQGRALRALHPNIDSVAFVDRWTPAYRGFEIVANAPTGQMTVFGRGASAHVGLVVALLRAGYLGVARDHLEAATAEFPDDPRLQLLQERVADRLTGGPPPPQPHTAP